MLLVVVVAVMPLQQQGLLVVPLVVLAETALAVEMEPQTVEEVVAVAATPELLPLVLAVLVRLLFVTLGQPPRQPEEQSRTMEHTPITRLPLPEPLPPLNYDRTLRVEIGGTTYCIHAKTTND